MKTFGNRWLRHLVIATGAGLFCANAYADLGTNLSIGAGSDGSSKADGSSFSYLRDGDMNTYWSPLDSTGRVSVKWSTATPLNTVIIREAAGFEGNIGNWELRNHDTGQLLESGMSLPILSQESSRTVTTVRKVKVAPPALPAPQVVVVRFNY